MPDQPRSNQPDREDFEQALHSMGTYTDVSVDDLMELTQRAQRIARRRATEALDIRQVMSQPVLTVQPQTSLATAAHLMVSERISGLPVVDDDGRLVGLITEADFLRALGVPAQTNGHSIWQTLESLFNHLAHQDEVETPTDPVSEHMVRNVKCVGPDQDLHHVLEIMKRYSVKRVLVCDADKHVLGVVTRSDLVRVFFDRYT